MIDYNYKIKTVLFSIQDIKCAKIINTVETGDVFDIAEVFSMFYIL